MQNYKKIPTYASIWGIILHFSSFCNGNLQFPIFNLHFPISNASMFLDASVLLLAGKFLVYVPKLNSGSEYSELVLGRLGLPDCLPCSKCQVKALLHALPIASATLAYSGDPIIFSEHLGILQWFLWRWWLSLSRCHSSACKSR